MSLRDTFIQFRIRTLIQINCAPPGSLPYPTRTFPPRVEQPLAAAARAGRRWPLTGHRHLCWTSKSIADPRRYHLAGTRTSGSVPVAKGDGGRVRSGLAAGTRWIRTLGPPSEGCVETELQSRICPRLLARGMRFAEDSPLEGSGFEPSVPLADWGSSRELLLRRCLNESWPVSTKATSRGARVFKTYPGWSVASATLAVRSSSLVPPKPKARPGDHRVQRSGSAGLPTRATRRMTSASGAHNSSINAPKM
jgi:hypothetical protein